MSAPASSTTLSWLLREHAGELLALVVDLTVHAEDELAGHADLDAEVGRLLELLHGLQRRQEVGVAGRGGGVEIDTVGADLSHALADEDHVLHAELSGLHLLFASLVHLHHAEQIGRVDVGTVRCVVQAHVGHRAVEDREHRGGQKALDGDLVERDHRLGRLEGVVDPAELHGVEGEHAFEDFHGGFATYRKVGTARELRGDERARRFVLGQWDFVTGFDADHAPGCREDLDELVDLVVFENRDLALVSGVFGRLDDVLAQFVGSHLDGLAVTHPGPYLAHCVTPPLWWESAETGRRGAAGAARRDSAEAHIALWTRHADQIASLRPSPRGGPPSACCQTSQLALGTGRLLTPEERLPCEGARPCATQCRVAEPAGQRFAGSLLDVQFTVGPTGTPRA